jgi:hypothetical protein
VEDLENLFVIDSTNEGTGGGGGGGEGGAASTGEAALEGGSSSIRETSSRDAASIDILRELLTGDFNTSTEPLSNAEVLSNKEIVSFSSIDPFTVVAGVIDIWLSRWSDIESPGGGD